MIKNGPMKNKKNTKKEKIYLAGPEVFFSNSLEIGNKKKEICEKYGFEGLYPLDNEVPSDNRKPRDIGLDISKLNEKLINDCDFLVANIRPFRGPSLDVGTAYEIGYAKALGKKCYGYSNNVSGYNARVKDYYNLDINDKFDKNKMFIENFDMIDNLMIDGGIKDSGGFIITKSNFDEISLFEKLIITIYTQNIHDIVYNFKTKNEQGFTKSEIEELLKEFPNINMEKFSNAFIGNTCMLIDDEIITYHCDVEHALYCGIENRDLNIWEWD